MKIRLEKPGDIGPIVRAARKSQRVRQDDMAGAIGVSENFLGKVERGGETAQWELVFRVLEGLGIRVECDVPDGARHLLPEALRAKS